MLAERLEKTQEREVIQPELVLAVIFSQKYSVPSGFSLACQVAVIWVWESAVKVKLEGILAKVYFEEVAEKEDSLLTASLALT